MAFDKIVCELRPEDDFILVETRETSPILELGQTAITICEDGNDNSVVLNRAKLAQLIAQLMAID